MSGAATGTEARPGSPWDQGLHVDAKSRAARRSVAASAFLTAIKLAAALYSGSLGLLAEAAHSALDLGAAAITWVAVRASWRPPDAEHHYGHGKIESLAALAETWLLALTSLWIVREAVVRLAGDAAPLRAPGIAAAIVVLSIAVDLGRSRELSRVAALSSSQALEADALHFRSDILTSAVVLLGLAAAWAARSGGPKVLALADPIAAVLVAAFVLVLAWKLGRRSVDMLLDRAPEGLRAEIERAIEAIPGLVEPPRVRVRQAGDMLFADVEIPLRPGLPVAEADRVASEAREAVRRIAGPRSSVLIQPHPVPDEGASVRQRVAEAVAREGLHAHNITLRLEGGRAHADLHLELPGRISLGEGHAAADRVEARILADVPEVVRVDTHLELHDDEAEPVVGLDAGERASLEGRVLEIARRTVGDGRLHDLLLRRTPSGLYLSCHCFFPASTPLAAAHRETDRLELALRGALPELRRVAVHAEPEGTPHAGGTLGSG